MPDTETIGDEIIIISTTVPVFIVILILVVLIRFEAWAKLAQVYALLSQIAKS